MSGATQATGGDLEKAEKKAATHPGIFKLLAIRKYPDDHPGYNPSLYMAAYDKKMIAKMAGGIQNLQAFANGLSLVSEPNHLSGGPFEMKVGNADGYSIHIAARLTRVTIQQYIYNVETPRYYITLTASLIEDDDYATLKKAISTLRMEAR
jgi:hypothetical protein